MNETALHDVDVEHARRGRGPNENDAVVRVQPVVDDVTGRRRLHPVRRFHLQQIRADIAAVASRPAAFQRRPGVGSLRRLAHIDTGEADTAHLDGARLDGNGNTISAPSSTATAASAASSTSAGGGSVAARLLRRIRADEIRTRGNNRWHCSV